MPKRKAAIDELVEVMARLRSPTGCPWDREQDHMSLRFHAVEEVYELVDAIESADDAELEEELGDLLLQVVFHCQLANERGAFNFERVARHITDKLIRRHPHVFGDVKVKNVDQVWANWEVIKKAEKQGTHRERSSVFDGIPRHLPALLRAEKLAKKARKAGLLGSGARRKRSRTEVAQELATLAEEAQSHGWSAEELLRAELREREQRWRKAERNESSQAKPSTKTQRTRTR
jgi:MazG family protein